METTMLVIGPLPTPEQAGKLLPCKKEIRIGDEGRLVFSGESFGIGPHSVPSMAINDDKIRLNSDGTASAWLTVCSTYKDESGKPHGTAITWFYATPDDKHNFRPSETVEGKFYPLGAGAVTY
jgi:hypothetical protein